MLSATTMDLEFSPAWNIAALEIRRAGVEDGPVAHFSASTSSKSWSYLAGNALTTSRIVPARSIDALGWTPAEALETHLRLRAFAEDWDAPGMEAYDAPLIQRDPVSETFQPKTELGKKLLALRRAYVSKGGPLLDAETFDRELQQRRGGVPDEQANLP